MHDQSAEEPTDARAYTEWAGTWPASAEQRRPQGEIKKNRPVGDANFCDRAMAASRLVLVLATLHAACLHAVQMASECGVKEDRCGYDDKGKPARVSHGTHVHHGDELVFHPEDNAHECCDGLLCEDGICKRPWGGHAPSAKDLKALYDAHAPGDMTIEKAAAIITRWQDREERLLTSVRLKYERAQRKDEL